MEDLQARHRKELKALEGEKRAAMKKSKATKGKKAKEVLTALEEEYATKLQEMKCRHQEELQALGSSIGMTQQEPQEAITSSVEKKMSEQDTTIDTMDTVDNKEVAIKERKQEKARRKREQERLKQKQLYEEQQRDLEGPSARKEELAAIQTLLTPLNLEITPVISDGHCLYRAVAKQLVGNQTYLELRQLCATALEQHKEEFSPFMEYTEDIPTFEMYVERIRTSADWGGHVELRALSLALQRPILVYSAQQSHPLEIHHGDDSNEKEQEPIRLSYHLHYYSLGEHYNCVMPKSNEDMDEHDDKDQHHA